MCPGHLRWLVPWRPDRRERSPSSSDEALYRVAGAALGRVGGAPKIEGNPMSSMRMAVTAATTVEMVMAAKGSTPTTSRLGTPTLCCVEGPGR